MIIDNKYDFQKILKSTMPISYIENNLKFVIKRGERMKKQKPQKQVRNIFLKLKFGIFSHYLLELFRTFFFK